MMIPRAPIPPGNYGLHWISESIDVSKRPKVLYLGRLFMRMSRAKRVRNGYRAGAEKMAIKFAKQVGGPS